MPDLLTLTCPSCGAKLKVTDNVSLLACANCGNEHMVHRDGGAIYLAPMAQDVRHIRTGVDKTAAELAVARLTKEIAELDAELLKVHSSTDSQSESSSFGIALIVCIGAVILFFAFIIMTNGVRVLGLIGIAIALIAFGFAIKLQIEKVDRLHKMRKSDGERITLQLRSKHEQLKKNQQISETG